MKLNLDVEINVYCDSCAQVLDSYNEATDGTIGMWVKPCACEEKTDGRQINNSIDIKLLSEGNIGKK